MVMAIDAEFVTLEFRVNHHGAQDKRAVDPESVPLRATGQVATRSHKVSGLASQLADGRQRR